MPGVVRDALKRIIGFEIQFGPFAVAQLRLLAEVADLIKTKGTKAKNTVPSDVHLRLYITNTLGNPDEKHEYIPQILKPLAESPTTGQQGKAGRADHGCHWQSPLQGESKGEGRMG